MTINKEGDIWEFNNNKLRKTLPSDLAPEEIENKDTEEYRGFLLTLGVIFNDLKGLTIFNDTLPDIYRQPPNEEVSDHSGEYNGLRMQLLKMLYATEHEFLVFLENNHKTYESEYIQRLLSNCSNDTQQLWSLLSRIARGVPATNREMNEFGELADQLQQIRDNIGFHYQTRNRLLMGFRRFFYGIMKTAPDAKKWAYWSGTKTSFNGIRFYYADAALQGYLMNIFKDEETAKARSERAFDLMAYIGRAISDLLLEYHAKLPSR